MKFELKTHKPGEPPANFWIQNKGHHSGRPLKTPIRNCFAVYTEEPFLFEYCYCLWKIQTYSPFIIGSVIPFIRKKDVENVIKKIKDTTEARETCKKVRIIDRQIETNNKYGELLKETQKTVILMCFKKTYL